jgi:hypothetical protein
MPVSIMHQIFRGNDEYYWLVPRHQNVPLATTDLIIRQNVPLTTTDLIISVW